MGKTEYKIVTRHGWGWKVVGESGNYESYPIESAIAAQKYADALNAGKTLDEARESAGVVFRDMRWYHAERFARCPICGSVNSQRQARPNRCACRSANQNERMNMNREKTQYAKHVELSVHNVVSAKLGKSSTLRDGTQARELFIVTRDGETVTVNLFAKSDISVRSAREKFPSISTRDLRSGKLIEVMLHDRGIE